MHVKKIFILDFHTFAFVYLAWIIWQYGWSSLQQRDTIKHACLWAIKFSFSEKATKICASKCQNHEED